LQACSTNGAKKVMNGGEHPEQITYSWLMKHRNGGFTLIEALVALGIAGILLTLGMPNFTEILNRHRLVKANDTLAASLQYARSEAIKQNKTVRLLFQKTTATVWCYGMVDAAGADCNCNVPSSCTINGVPRVVSSTQFRGVILQSLSATFYTFTSMRGTSNAGTVEFRSPEGKNARSVISALGRVRVCSDNSVPTSKLTEYPPC
jgi:type IV fimbrial biogenesis protein FimT